MLLWKFIFFYRNQKFNTKTTIFLEKNILKPVLDLAWSITTQTNWRTSWKEACVCGRLRGRKARENVWLPVETGFFLIGWKRPQVISLSQSQSILIFAYLCPGFNEFKKVRPGLVNLIFPLGDSGSVSVTCANKLITYSIRGSHLFRSSIGGISCEIAEFLNEQLLKSW